MLRRLIALLLVVFWCNNLVAQDGPLISRLQFITVKEGMAAEFRDAAAKKTKKYNGKEGSLVFNTWRIMNGPRQGKFVRGTGFRYWADFDTPIPQNELDYWTKNVVPYIEKYENTQIWSYNDDVSYNGSKETEYANVGMLQFYNINPGMDGRLMEMAKKLKEVHESKKTTFRYGWYHLESGGDRSTWLFASSVYKWADLGGPAIGKLFEEVHGEGSWSEFMKEFGEVVQKSPKARRAEFWRFLKDMSSPPR